MWNTLIIALCLASGTAYARPHWMAKRPPDDSSYRYYIGRSGSQGDEKKAYEMATQDAYDSAVRENFGVTTRVDIQSYETGTETNLAKHIENSTSAVVLKGFEQIDSYMDQDGDSLQLWALFRYAKSEITLQKEQMDTNNGASPLLFSESGDRSNPKTGILEIVTDPPGADVRIDGEKINFQKTPLRMYGELPVGPHKLEIDHPLYDIHERVFVVMMGRKIEIHQRLYRSKSTLSIVTEPPGATIFINGKIRGTTPLKSVGLLVGEEHKIEVTHPKAEKTAQTIVLERGEIRELQLTLPLKPGKLIASSQPSGAEVVIDDLSRGLRTPTGPISLSAGTYTIRLQKEGVGEYEERMEIKPGETAYIRSAKLKNREVDSVPQIAAYEYSKQITDPRTQLGLNIYYRTPTLKYFEQPNLVLGISLHHRFTRVVGLEGELMYGISRRADYSNGSVQQQNWGGRFGIAFYPIPETNVYFSPEYLSIENTLNAKTSPLDTSGTKATITQSAYGLGVSILSFSEPNANSKAGGWGVRVAIHQFSQGVVSWMLGISVYNFGL